jgi:hypothetical protein
MSRLKVIAAYFKKPRDSQRDSVKLPSSADRYRSESAISSLILLCLSSISDSIREVTVLFVIASLRGAITMADPRIRPTNFSRSLPTTACNCSIDLCNSAHCQTALELTTVNDPPFPNFCRRSLSDRLKSRSSASSFVPVWVSRFSSLRSASVSIRAIFSVRFPWSSYIQADIVESSAVRIVESVARMWSRVVEIMISKSVKFAAKITFAASNVWVREWCWSE